MFNCSNNDGDDNNDNNDKKKNVWFFFYSISPLEHKAHYMKENKWGKKSHAFR